ncbi:VOC family protein [Kineosporia sp. NBRC 101731]|uniref:VOC family protein n=1 Tax=Kineosporia sp. NBRC 101731 TaxID=3032199 RepID=UPI0024A10BD9|nr:VOC family protein [Kineosporia sp. NBRC 101731]GLY32328.1 hypothetical protein Kisp02_56930 [Kineosporia sp. NBRC 101731]
MAAQFNHTIVRSADQRRSARFLADLLGLPAPVEDPPFTGVVLGNGVTLDFLSVTGPVPSQHYAFLLEDIEFDDLLRRLHERGLTYWGGPEHRGEGRINRRDGGRGVYFDDPDGHALEAITRPYGGWPTPE